MIPSSMRMMTIPKPSSIVFQISGAFFMLLASERLCQAISCHLSGGTQMTLSRMALQRENNGACRRCKDCRARVIDPRMLIYQRGSRMDQLEDERKVALVHN